MKGVLPWLFRCARRAGTSDFCSAMAALFGPVQNIFSSPYTISILLSPSPRKLIRQSCWVACWIHWVLYWTSFVPGLLKVLNLKANIAWWTLENTLWTWSFVAFCYYTALRILFRPRQFSVGDPWRFGADPDPYLWLKDPTPSLILRMQKKYSYFLVITCLQARHLQSKNCIFC